MLSSRISNTEEEWFIDRAKTAPWETVPPGSALADADPCEVSGLYDSASNLYSHFRDAAPTGVAAAKVYKVLHLMRPNVFPILDSRLQRVYDKAARAAAVVVNGCRPDLPDSKWAYWAAIRIDVAENRSQIEAVRQAFAASGNPFLADAARTLTDVRILDILTWVGASEVS